MVRTKYVFDESMKSLLHGQDLVNPTRLGAWGPPDVECVPTTVIRGSSSLNLVGSWVAAAGDTLLN